MTLRAQFLHQEFPAGALVPRATIREALARPFDAELLAFAQSPDLDVDGLVGSTGAVHLFDSDHDPLDPANARFFHGVIEEASYERPDDEGRHLYWLRLRPQLHGLAYRVRSRIFQDMSATDVVKRVFEDAGLDAGAVTWSTTQDAQRTYVTQWKESELAFVQRLLEEQGLYYWFEHEADGHSLVVCDNAAHHEELPHGPVLPVTDTPATGTIGVYHASFRTRMTYDGYAARDWEWQQPGRPRQAPAPEGSGFEHFEYPGGFEQDDAGVILAAQRLAALNVRRTTLVGASNHRHFAPGRTFGIADAYPEALIGNYLLTSVRHEIRDSGFEGQSRRGAGRRYEARFEAMPAELPFRPTPSVKKPVAGGIESAVVTGPAGEEIHVDSYGRIKVHFYWDREGAVDDTASCWLRVQQQNTANQMMLPRVGWEVSVAFLDGDPDRPVALQKLYNQETLPPYELPANLMQSSLQSSSSPGGGGTNEMRMNDSDGGQEWFAHAQRDYRTNVGNNRSDDIGVDSRLQVGVDCTSAITGDESCTVSGSQSASVTGAATHQTAGSKTVDVGANDQWEVSALHTVITGGARTESISGLLNVLAERVEETINGDVTRSVGGALCVNGKGPIVEAIAGDKQEATGGAKIEIVTDGKAENIGVAKALSAGVCKIETGEGINVAADGALAITTGGPMVIKCGGDFAISGDRVSFTIGKLDAKAGAKLSATPGKIVLDGSSIGSKGASIKVKGTVKYK